MCVCAGATCCVQAHGVAVSGSYAYVVGATSDSLAIVDVSNKAAPTLTGSLIDSTVMDGVRCSTHARQRPLYSARSLHCTRPGADGGAYGVAARGHVAAAWWTQLRLAAASGPHAASAFACAAMAHLASAKAVGVAAWIVCVARHMCVHGLVSM